MLKCNSASFAKFIKKQGIEFVGSNWRMTLLDADGDRHEKTFRGNAEDVTAYVAYYKVYFGDLSETFRDFLASKGLFSSYDGRKPRLYNL